MRSTVIAAIGIGLLAACEGDPVGPSAPALFVATIEGSVSASYEGSGRFFTTPDARRPAAPRTFMLHSHGIGDARGHGFELFRTGDIIPPVGSYSLGGAGTGPADLSAVYTIREGQLTYRYAARSGWLEVTESSPSRIAGELHFEAVRVGVCTSSRGAFSCTVLPSSDPDTPTVNVTGSFEAVR